MLPNCEPQILSSEIFDKIWVPDLDVDHFKTFNVKSIVKEQRFLRLRYEAEEDLVVIDYSFGAAVTVSCSMTLDRYPFADTTCKYKLVSYKLDSSFIIFEYDPLYNISRPLDLQETEKYIGTRRQSYSIVITMPAFQNSFCI
jgi:hypothetical protein